MSDRPRSTSTWLRLLDGSKSLFVGHGYEASPIICSEASFRTAFEELYSQYKEKYIPRLLAKLPRSYKQIIAFADGVSEPVRDLPPDGLTGLVWGASFATIKASLSDLRALRH